MKRDLTPIRADQVEIYLEPSGAHEIVKELAARGPFATHGMQDSGCATCALVYEPGWGWQLGVSDDERAARNPFVDPANHEPSCLWRRAKALYP